MFVESKRQPDRQEPSRFRNPSRGVLPLAALTATIATAAAFLAPETAFAASDIQSFDPLNKILITGLLAGATAGGLLGSFIRSLHRNFYSIRRFEAKIGLGLYRIHSEPLILTSIATGAVAGAVWTHINFLS